MAGEPARHDSRVLESGPPLSALSADRGRVGDEGALFPGTARSLFLELFRAVLEGREGEGEALVSRLEDWAGKDPRAPEVLEEVLEGAAGLVEGDAGVFPTPEKGSHAEHALLRAKVMALEACLKGRRRRERELAQRWRQIESFPDTLAAVVDPTTLARKGLARIKELLHLEGAALFEADGEGRMVPLVGDTEGRIGEKRISGKAAEDFFRKREPLTAGRLAEECGWGLQGGWERSVLLPMAVRGRVTGGLLLKPPAKGDGEERGVLDLETAERFAVRLAEALENARLHAREQKKIREVLALLEISRVVGSTLDLEEILDRVAGMVVEISPVTQCAAYLEEDGVLRLRASRGFMEEGSRELGRGRSLRPEDLGAEAWRVLEEGRPFVLPAREAGVLLPQEALEEHGIEEVLLQPLRARGKTVGFLALFQNGRPGEAESWEERQLAEAVAAQASLAVENASLYQDIERSYFSTVQALAKAIEVKDPYTRGHSERVTTYALMIAEAMGLDERERQKLKYAATLHDIGKIGIAGRVLNKPGALTEEEYTHVKTHPILGDSIVEPVEFLQEPRPIILHHHERYDGRGYPDGLKGEDIPLCARILSVADAFEAMRSDRPYRKALPLEEARQELVRNAGTQFDPRVVEVFLRILEEHGGDPITREGVPDGAAAPGNRVEGPRKIEPSTAREGTGR